MKKLFILLLLVLSIQGFSQTKNIELVNRFDDDINEFQEIPTFKSSLSETSFISDSSITTVLDGSSWVNSQKHEYNYDVRGNVTLDITSNWESGQWVYSTKSESVYNSLDIWENSNRYNWDNNLKVWVDNSKRVQIYNEEGNRILWMGHRWDTNSQSWIGDLKVIWEYDSNNNETKDEEFQWDENTNDWVGTRKVENLYNENSDKLERLDSQWDINTNQWVYDYKYEYTYDVNLKLTEHRDFRWDTTTNQWNNTNFYTYHYDEVGVLLYINKHEIWYISINPLFDPYDNYKLSEYSYDGEGRVLEIITYNYTLSTDTKGYSSKIEYGFDEYGNTILNSRYNWSSNQWIGYHKTEYSYNVYGNNTLYSSYGWDYDMNIWKGYFKDVNFYDEDGNHINHIRYKWEENQWVNDYKNEYDRDENGNNFRDNKYTWDGTQWIKTSIITYYFSLVPPSDIILSDSMVDENSEIGTEIGVLSSVDVNSNGTFTYTLISGDGDTDNSSFTITDDKLLSGEVFDFETKSSYSIRIQTDDGNGGTFSKSFTITVNSTLGINDYFNENVKVYPNPIKNNSFTIETPFNHTVQLNLMDIYGRTILTKDLLQNSNLIRLENISDGLYFIQLLDDNKIIHQQKIIKKN